jgi:hypothetical protein
MSPIISAMAAVEVFYLVIIYLFYTTIYGHSIFFVLFGLTQKEQGNGIVARLT